MFIKIIYQASITAFLPNEKRLDGVNTFSILFDFTEVNTAVIPYYLIL